GVPVFLVGVGAKRACAGVQGGLGELRDLRLWRQRLVGNDFEATTIDREHALRAVDLESGLSARGDLAARPRGDEGGVLEDRVEDVRRFAEAAERPPLRE